MGDSPGNQKLLHNGSLRASEIPSHRFLFYPGNVEANEYMDLLQLEDCEFEVIRTASKGRCLFQCGNERYKLLVQAPEYKEGLFGMEGGR